MRYCEHCGTLLGDEANFCPACGNACQTSEVEPKSAFCEHCGAKLDEGDMFCQECGQQRLSAREYSEELFCLSSSESEAIEKKDTSSRHSSDINYICLVLLIVAAFLGLFAPFGAINYLTMGNQPTALQLIMDDVVYWGEITEAPAYWAAVVAMLGIVVCFIFTVAKRNQATRIVAILTELPLGFLIIQVFSWADDIEEIFDVLGIGFWGILLLLLFVACISGD